MSSSKISISTDVDGVAGKKLVSDVIDPEILLFSEWFESNAHGGSSLTRMEVDLLRSYLYQKLTGVL